MAINDTRAHTCHSLAVTCVSIYMQGCSLVGNRRCSKQRDKIPFLPNHNCWVLIVAVHGYCEERGVEYSPRLTRLQDRFSTLLWYECNYRVPADFFFGGGGRAFLYYDSPRVRCKVNSYNEPESSIIYAAVADVEKYELKVQFTWMNENGLIEIVYRVSCKSGRDKRRGGEGWWGWVCVIAVAFGAPMV